ncbi:GreA/GreB family elongation factor [Fictibacillus sp. KIGAM418]|uniref:GreA/GreB family elongation factor n=1 Tax=Fictibacillus marinisediminis TaxID=2878389 RepID=A0A9X1X768_9BACL|nr:GreA/GreB family elongation factor [Fictibacillus marinisediminis]MCK6255156.1 GreA/GreB family elongation factor [Fictibacillus marinisediminis]
MNHETVLLTNEGTRRLKHELRSLIEEKVHCRTEDEGLFLDKRIKQLEQVLFHARILSSEKEPGQTAEVGSTITLLELEFQDEMTYTIVHPFEADPREFKIAADSPVAQAVIGKPLNAKIHISLPGGHISYKIINIQNCKR